MPLQLIIDTAYLAPPTDDALVELPQRAAEPDAVLPAARSHFVMWIQDRTRREIEQQHIARVQANRDLTRRPGWTIDLAVIVEGKPAACRVFPGSTNGRTAASWEQRHGCLLRFRAAALEPALAQQFSNSHLPIWALS
jgi:hypothetical protein